MSEKVTHSVSGKADMQYHIGCENKTQLELKCNAALDCMTGWESPVQKDTDLSVTQAYICKLEGKKLEVT